MSIEGVESVARRREVIRRLFPLIATVVAVAGALAVLSGAVTPHVTIVFKAPVAPYRQAYVAAHYVWLGGGRYVIEVRAYSTPVEVSAYCTVCGGGAESALVRGFKTLRLSCRGGLVIEVSASVPPYHSRVCEVEVSRVGWG